MKTQLKIQTSSLPLCFLKLSSGAKVETFVGQFWPPGLMFAPLI